MNYKSFKITMSLPEMFINRVFIGFALVFTGLAAIYFCLYGGYILFFQEQLALFVYTWEFFHEFLNRPGGLLEYAGLFLTQFYFNSFTGSLLLAAVLTLPAFISFAILKKSGTSEKPALMLFMVPSCLLLLMQTFRYHMMYYNLGLISVIAAFFFVIHFAGKKRVVAETVLFAILYYFSGAWAFLFLLMALTGKWVSGENSYNYKHALVLSTVAALVLLTGRYLFHETFFHLATNPLPLLDEARYRWLSLILAVVLIMLPFFASLSKGVTGRMPGLSSFPLFIPPALVIVSFIFVGTWSNSQTIGVIKLSKLVADKDWVAVIDFHQKYPSRNLVGQFYYNLALAETNQLSSNLFFGKQDFGPNSLILPWGDAHLNRGSLFYYATGLVNEAHRWAYESMVIYGLRPANLILLIETNLINGNLRIAEKYISLLKNTRNYRSKADEYKLILTNPETIKNHPVLEEKMSLRPVDGDFFIDTEMPFRNILMLLDTNPSNRKAFEYRIAWHLLNKEVPEAVSLIPELRGRGYEFIPRHLEEAVLVYSNATGIMPDLDGYNLSIETQLRFSQYVNAYNTIRQNPGAEHGIIESFDNTLWYYMHFN